MKRIVSILLCAVALMTACREFQENPLPRDLIVTAETELSTADGFINSVYALRVTVEQKNRVSDFPVTATYTVNKKAVVKSGVKMYANDDDTLMFSMRKPRKISVQPTETGTYRLMMTFKDNGGKEIGTKELNFNVQTTDLNMYIVRDGKRVENMEETENFLGYEGSFIVRINSEKEDLNKGRLKLTANITGSSVQVKNWQDKEAKISQSDDRPETVDFLVEYKNVALGKTRFVFTAESANSSAMLRDSMNVKESRPGTLSLNTTYNEEKNFYSREELWVGQTDSVGYLITPDPKAVSNVYRIKFEQKDPTRINFFATGDPEQFFTGHEYLPNQWYDFSDRLNGKFYYFSKGPTSYSDTVIISLQNGDMGPITKYKFFVSSKQSDDFDFNVTFKPTLDEKGYDVIKYSELFDGINNPIELKVKDENPYSEFDIQVLGEYINELQRYIVQRAKKIGHGNASNVPYGDWIGEEYGYMKADDTKSFSVDCGMHPNDETTPAYLANTFNWVYNIKRRSDEKQKTVTRQIKIIDDRIDFEVDALVAKQEAYQNETVSMFQMTYSSTDNKSENYQLIVTSSNESVADVYLINSSGSFIDQEVIFGTAMAPPASHNVGGNTFPQSGHIQIKGKEAGTAELTFKLKHKASGATREITQTVTTKADPVVYTIEPAPTIDAMNKERTAIPFNGQFHTYQNPRFKIRITSGIYEKNRIGTASVVFSTVADGNNVATLYISETGFIGKDIAYNDVVKLSYDKDYFVTVSAPTSFHPWNVPAGSEQWLDVKMTTATNQETKITVEKNGLIKYTLRAYNKPVFTVTATITSHDNVYYTESYEETGADTNPYMFWCTGNTGIAVLPEYIGNRWIVPNKDGYANYYVNNAAVIIGESKLNDAHETSRVSLKKNNASYNVFKAKGAYMKIGNDIDYFRFPQCTTYGSIPIDVTDNWGYQDTEYFTPAKKSELLEDYKF